ncbi:MAG: hypothetical protein WC650_03395 [Candidatus Doudnabacteria bacterium]
MRIIFLSVIYLLLAFIVGWLGWGIYDLCYLKVSPLSVVFQFKTGELVTDLSPGGHWVYSKGNYMVEPLLPPGRNEVTDAEIILLRKVAKEDGWVNFCNYRAAMAGE